MTVDQAGSIAHNEQEPVRLLEDDELAQKAVLAERERCAKIAEAYLEGAVDAYHASETIRWIADEIRKGK